MTIISIRAIDVGFDLRIANTPVVLGADVSAVEFDASPNDPYEVAGTLSHLGGKRLVRGTRSEIIATLTRHGYTVADDGQ